jgi:hypothetical protein
MSQDEGRYHFNRLLQRVRTLKSVDSVLISLSVSLVVVSMIEIFLASTVSVIIGVSAGLCYLAYRTVKRKSWNYPAESLIANLHNQFVSFEESLDLIAFDNPSLTNIQQLQREKIQRQFLSSIPDIKISSNWFRSLAFLIVAIGVLYTSNWIIEKNKSTVASERSLSKSAVVPKVLKTRLPASIKSLTIKIQPPAYTKRENYASENANLTIPEGSRVEWSIVFSDSVSDGEIMLAGQDNKIKSVRRSPKTFTAQGTLSVSTFYKIQWTNQDDLTKSSDFYKIEIIRDQHPLVAITNLEQSVDLTLNDKLHIDIKAQLSDDYGLSDSYLIATVSKGSGESVKFREEKLMFTSPKQIAGKSVSATRSLDLLKLGMEPGDELYLYAEVLDNKTPTANKARTETFFITLRDTASHILSVEGGLGVDLMPDYFRSQRQIIIDTEKLLKEKNKFAKKEFNSTSNELGYDQKVLRLKYGEFLGEEFETRIGDATPVEGEESTDDIAKKYTHVHDTENEHNLVDDKKDKSVNHPNEEDGDKTQSLADAYKHEHDDAEEATFFNQSIRSKLKAALTEMWDAELYLRLYQPEKSLPYQYKALKLLKEVSNDSRIYVHRTGFDPPPIKEEKRLTGDLAEIKTTSEKQNNLQRELYPAIRLALQLTQNKLSKPDYKISQSDKKIFHAAGIELAQLAVERPGAFLNALTLLKSLDEDELSNQKIKSSLREIQKAFWAAIPNAKTTPTTELKSAHAIDRTFMKTLDALNNE